MQNIASVAAQTLAPAVASAIKSYFGGRKRGRRGRNKNKKTGGFPPLPSAPRAPGRGRRGGRNQYKKPISNSKASASKNVPKLGAGMPAAVSGQSFGTYFKQTGAPMHKEWGQGVRYTGCSILGTLESNAVDNHCYINAISQLADGGTYNQYYDLFPAVNNDTTNATSFTNAVMCLHPGLIPRLQNECYAWGRYCYRSITIHSQAVGPTTDTGGFTAGLSHDVAWPLNQDQATVGSLSAVDIAELGNHMTVNFYEDFSLRSDDFTGDRTWSTTIPVVNVTKSGGPVDASYLWPWIDASYQYFWTIIQPQHASLTGYRGYVFATYVVDFYSVQNNNDRTMNAMNWNGAPTTMSRSEKLEMKLPRLPPRAPRLYSQVIGRNTDRKLDEKSITQTELKFIGRVRDLAAKRSKSKERKFRDLRPSPLEMKSIPRTSSGLSEQKEVSLDTVKVPEAEQRQRIYSPKDEDPDEVFDEVLWNIEKSWGIKD